MTKSLKRKKRATKLLSPTNPSSRPVRKRRQPEYLKDYHLGTLPLETPIRNTDLPPAHSNVCILCRMFHWFCVVFQKNTKRTLTSPLQSPIVRKTPKVVRVVVPEDDPTTTDDEENLNEVNIVMSATIRYGRENNTDNLELRQKLFWFWGDRNNTSNIEF